MAPPNERQTPHTTAACRGDCLPPPPPRRLLSSSISRAGGLSVRSCRTAEPPRRASDRGAARAADTRRMTAAAGGDERRRAGGGGLDPRRSKPQRGRRRPGPGPARPGPARPALLRPDVAPAVVAAIAAPADLSARARVRLDAREKSMRARAKWHHTVTATRTDVGLGRVIRVRFTSKLLPESLTAMPGPAYLSWSLSRSVHCCMRAHY